MGRSRTTASIWTSVPYTRSRELRRPAAALPPRCRGVRSLRHLLRKLRAGLDVELAEHLVEVVLDGARTDEQLGRDLPVRTAFGRKPRDLRLLGSQLVKGVHRPFARAFARRLEFNACALGERLHPEAAEELVGDPKLVARIGSSPFASQPLAVQKVSPREVQAQSRWLEQIDCLAVKRAGRFSL